MDAERIGHLAEKVEDMAGGAASGEIMDALAYAFPQARQSGAFRGGMPEAAEDALALVGAALPGWAVTLEGEAKAAARWTCILRPSHAPDDEEMAGIGRAGSMSRALIAALLRVARSAAGAA